MKFQKYYIFLEHFKKPKPPKNRRQPNGTRRKSSSFFKRMSIRKSSAKKNSVKKPDKNSNTIFYDFGVEATPTLGLSNCIYIPLLKSF